MPETDPTNPNFPPTPSEASGMRQAIQLSNVPNVDATNCDNHVSGSTNVVFTGTTRDQVNQNTSDILILQAAQPPEFDWAYYADHWDSEPTTVTPVTGGNVRSYTLGGVTRYRFEPDPYDPHEDAFYANFDGTNLTNLIVRRNNTTV